MVRVAGLHDQIDAGIEKPLQDGRTPKETMEAIRVLVREHAAAPDALPGPRPAARAGRARHPDRRLRRRRPPTSGAASTSASARQIFPVLTPLAVGLGRPFPYISNLSLSLGVMVRDPITEVETFARVKVPKEMLPRFVPVGDGTHVRGARGADRREPRRALPGHGDHRPRVLPRHPRRRLHGLRRGRRPAAGRRGRAARAPLRRARARRGLGRHERGDARADHARAEGRARGRHRDQRASSTSRTCGRSSACPATPTCATRSGRRSRSRCCSPTRTSCRTCMGAMRKRDILLHHPYDSFVTLGRALRRPGGQRPGRARDQADRVPHQRRLAARPRR